MMNRRRFIGSAIAATSASSIWLGCERKEFDIIIHHGRVFDGLGQEPTAVDVGIRGDRIIALGDLSGRSCGQTIDAAGQAVSPGFIDVHTHSDMPLLVNPKAESKIRQGVTTEILGNCGDSPFPLDEVKSLESITALRNEYKIKIDWRDLAGYLHRLEKNGISVNVVPLVGHSALRQAVMGTDHREPTAVEMAKMKSILRDYLHQGARGLSTGLEYKPGMYAATAELIELCKEVANVGGVYATHLRNEDVAVQEALAEALAIGAASGCRVQISHLKASQKRNWYKTPLLLTALEQARINGVVVCADRYPYTAYSTSLKLLFPFWSREGSNKDFIARLQSESEWKKILVFLQDKINALGSWQSVMITRLSSKERKGFQGKTIAQLAAGSDAFQFVRQLLIDENGDVGMCGFGMSEEDTAAILAHPYTMVGSDGDALAPYGILSGGTPHPRSYGSFPRYLGLYVREKKILPLAEAIRRITSFACQHFSLVDRGVIAAGKFADLAIFNPDTIIDQSTFTSPHQYPLGISCVIVNGRVVIHNDRHTGEQPGRILLSA